MSAITGRALGSEERSRLAILALPTTALALAIVSEVVRRYTDDAIVIGLIIGGEGVMALWIALLARAWSDQLRTRIGGRLPFVIGGAVPAAIALPIVGLVHSMATDRGGDRPFVWRIRRAQAGREEIG